MDMRTLAQKHQEACKTLEHAPHEALLLWYADLGVEVDDEGDAVDFHCPKCGARRTMALELFVCIDERADLRCRDCWGDPGEHGGE